MGQVQVYHSTDTSAPTLTGAAGSLVALLDACLVSGYGSKPAAGWTKPFGNASSTGCYKINAGASFSGYISGNTLTVLSMISGAIGLNTCIQGPGVTAGTFVQALGTATATGQTGTYTLNNTMTVGSSGSPVGLTSGSTTLNTAASGTGNCLSVNDNGPGAGTFREARMTGFETLSSVSAGTGQWPTVGQIAIGNGALVVRKSTTADATVRPWHLIADDTCFYLFTETGDFISPTMASCFHFGDIFSYKANDQYATIMIGRNIENNASTTNEAMGGLPGQNAGLLNVALLGHYMDRSHTGIGGSLQVGKHTDQMKQSASSWNGGSGQTGGSGFNNASAGLGFNKQGSPFMYPNPVDGGIYTAPLWIHHTYGVRGYLKGAWAPLHDLPLNHLDTYSGSGNLAGKSFQAFNLINNVSGIGSSPAQIHIETSNTWG